MVWTALAAIALAFSAFTLIVRLLPLPNIVALLLSVGAPYVPVVALLGLILSVLSSRIMFSAAVVVLAATVVVQVPWYFFGNTADIGVHTDVRVLSSNLRKGRADPTSFVGLASSSADVIAVSELTPEEVRRFSGAGLDRTFPYSVLTPAPGAGGIGLWSRFPLTSIPQPRHEFTSIVAARLKLPGVRYSPLVSSVHVASPLSLSVNIFEGWRDGIANLRTSMADFGEAVGSGAVIVAGDFNSTADMRQFRDLLTNGYRDAIEQTGAGLSPTFPSHPWLRPLITIDHVLTRGAVVSTIRTVDISGSDHRALLATIKVPLDPERA